MIPSNEPQIIWSAILKKPTKWETSVKSTSALLVGRGFSGLEKFGSVMKKFFETYGELAAINMFVNSKK
ncbi:hypothetical protein JCM31826_22330 [Thermaurantimonas aggregans]|uniref:Uncharacterized protein n=1 Tax=Thermaurantimonas aggregans TaxID=2173829 RepID=A0A401XP11_9FLAO|nr:hypothetical protein [Thermaurantimonas aggregans]MCX8149554.1 hypothetical protein [Thermaurantimonas aggregans]GCD78751.1 hypothetical protein JCM31826_22330 [Thermaurantimonas aggregans]